MEPNSPGGVSAGPPGDADRPALSEREIEILILAASGASNKEIAQRLVISPNTVKVHLRNIFGKIGVASRTEATLYAIRAGLAPNPVGVAASAGDVAAADAALDEVDGQPAGAAGADSLVPAGRSPARGRALWLAAGAVVVLTVLGLLAWRALIPVDAPLATEVTPIPRWSERSPLPTARGGLAVAVYDNKLYAIGGQAELGVSGAVERYDPATDSWDSLAPKRLPVADVSAALVGGLIFVPGGRAANGQVTDVLEAYDPRRDAWEQRARLPMALSGYALAVFEGKVYLFGGWNGTDYVALTYVYDPDLDEWSERTRMASPRGLAGAAVIGERIYVIGGTDGERALTASETYAPAEDVPDGQPWRTAAPLPEARSSPGVVALAGAIHVLGGANVADQAVVYDVDTNAWHPVEAPPRELPAHPGAAALGGVISLLGGDAHLEYRAIYLLLIPVVAP